MLGILLSEELKGEGVGGGTYFPTPSVLVCIENIVALNLKKI